MVSSNVEKSKSDALKAYMIILVDFEDTSIYIYIHTYLYYMTFRDSLTPTWVRTPTIHHPRVQNIPKIFLEE